MLAGTDKRIDAAVPLITWNNLEEALFPNFAQPDGAQVPATPAAVVASDDGVFKRSWTSALVTSVVAGSALDPATAVDSGDTGSRNGFGGRGTSADSTSAPTPSGTTALPPPTDGPAAQTADDPGCGRLRADVCAAYAQVAQTGRITPTLSKLLARSSPAAVVGDITAPTLLVQGEQDTLFGLDQADANARAIAANGATVAVDWYRGGHDGGAPDQASTTWTVRCPTTAGRDPGCCRPGPIRGWPPGRARRSGRCH
jgi:ABC-2 type transport system ATP-binding protein